MTMDNINAVMEAQGKADALELQEISGTLSGTELNDEAARIPMFAAARAAKNMMERKAGFVCMSSSGRVVKLLQSYDSDERPQEPEMLPAQWGFVWSKDPAHARPFVALSTSPYGIDEVCSWGADIYASEIKDNVWSPADYPRGWRWVQSAR